MMLLKKESTLIFSLHLKLTFDDATITELDIKSDDYIIAKFLYAGGRRLAVAKVLALDPIFDADSGVTTYVSSSLVLDLAKSFSSERLNLDIRDILNAKIVTEEYVNTLAPDYIVTEDMLLPDTEEPSTIEEVVV